MAERDWFLSQSTVTEGHAFDYAIPYRNEEADVHPPFYYFLMHTLSSLVPGKLSIPAGVGLNLCFLWGSTIVLPGDEGDFWKPQGSGFW
ncbi:MAG: hypothetical protein V8Q27_05755 [Eubacteriales bacterium]